MATLVHLVRSMAAFPTYPDLATLLVAVSATLLVGTVSGRYPAQRAARLKPIEALRHG